MQKIIGTDLEDEITRRAFAAYFRTDGTDQPTAATSGVEKHGGKHYAVLRNRNGVLACYRVRNDGKLKRLVRLPEEIK